ncbi:MAG: diguanylate cyclase [Butyrivibrio sp.]|nr:diguanylate cyclase [Butyrivibrio sp.]
MNKRTYDIRRISSLIFGIAVAVVVLIALFRSDTFDNSYKDSITAFSDGWRDQNGIIHYVEDVRVGDYGGSFSLSKQLPNNLNDDDCLCFESINVNLKVFIDGKERYSFNSKENISGMGYGIAFHQVGLGSVDNNRVVTIYFDPLFEGLVKGGVWEVFISPPQNYVKLKVSNSLAGVVISIIIILYGLIMIIVSMCIYDSRNLPFDITALGVFACVIGIWLLEDTKTLQLLTGAIYTCRVLNRFMVFLAGFPLICFFNSLTALKRLIYHVLGFSITAASIGFLLIARYFFKVDMLLTFTNVLIIYLVVIAVIVSIIFLDNAIYCRTNGIVRQLRYVFAGNIILLCCALMDFFAFVYGILHVESYGTFVLYGTLLFFIIMLTQFLRWWTRDQESIRRDRFVNKVMQYAISSDSSDKSIKAILSLLGKELGAGRVTIFEDQNNGKYHGAYDWYEKGRDPGAVDLLYLPYHGLIEDIYRIFNERNDKLIVENTEDCKLENFELFKILNANNVKNMVARGLKVNDRILGILVMLDIPKAKFSEASGIVDMTSYFISQFILRRDEEKRLKAYFYNDNLSGAYNRRAYREFIGEKLDISSPFGYLLCKIKGIDDANDAHGYDSGDKMIIEVSSYLMDVFGKTNVYRITGTQFAAFGFESDELFFNNDVDRFKKLIENSGINVAVGAVYCMYGTKDFSMVINKANELMNDN